MMQGKAQSGASAATLIAIIAGLILLYILLIPQAEREKILGNETGSAATGTKAAPKETALLLERPGTLTKLEQKEIEHRIDSFNIFTREEDKVIKGLDSLSFESSRGQTGSKKFFFNIDDPENTKNAILSLNVIDRSGRLIVKLNGEEILNEEVKGQRVMAVENLKSTNEMEFTAKEVPAWQFWARNFYEIKDVKIVATVIDIQNKDATQTFFVPENEASNIETASLTYFVDCSTSNVGKMSVYLNGFKVSSGIPDCGSLSKHSLDPKNIEAGNNELRFSTEEGTYLIDRVFVKTKLKQAIKPIYYFEVSQGLKREISNGTKQMMLRIKFVDDQEEKLGIINVNGHKTSFDTRLRPEYNKDITSSTEEGNNYIQIEPQVTLNIVEIRVEAIKK